MKAQSPGAVAKVRTGIHGFDEITEGGLPCGRTTLVMGGPGCGKTVFALHALIDGAHQKEAAVVVAFEESAGQLIANASTFGWDLPGLIKKKKLYILDARISPEVVTIGNFELSGMLKLLELKAGEMHAKRIVFDGIDVLLGLLNDPVAERRELYRIQAWLSRTGLTGLITQKVGPRGHQRYDFLQFMVDCVVVLRHQMIAGSSFRNLRVMKYRGSGFSADRFPITITAEGLQLANRGPAELRYDVSDERISTGLPRLDNMLHGGYHRGSNVLISGSPGTAKSTLAGLFAAAGCARGERTLYVSFDEGAAQIVRNLASVGIRLAPHQKSGLLKIYSTRTHGPNIEDQFSDLRAKVRAHHPRCLIIDPISALSTTIAYPASADAAQQFLDFLKGEGITVVNTTLMDGLSTDEATATGISIIADTWIHLSYVVHEGERNRALTIVKSRGTEHSNQVRELTLSKDGVTLTDVFAAQGKVLMGVARWQWEQKEQAAKQGAEVASDLKRLQLQLAQAEAIARLQVVQTEIEARSAEIKVLEHATGSASKLRTTDRAVLRKMRHADDDRAPRVRTHVGKSINGDTGPR